MGQTAPGKTLILYVGNPIVVNDQIGLIVGRRLASGVGRRPDVEVLESTGSPLDMLGDMEGFERLIVVDSMHLPDLPLGTVRAFNEDEIRAHARGFHVHGMNLADVLDVGRRMELPVPPQLVLIGVEAGAMDTFGEGLGPELAEAVERICREVAGLAMKILA